MTVLQIVLLSVAGAFALASLVFMVMFIVEISVKPREDDEEEVKSVFTIQNINIVNEAEENNNDVDAMLASIEEQTKDEAEEEIVEEAEEIVEEVENEQAEEVAEEVVEETAEEVVETVEEKEEPKVVEEVAETAEAKEEVAEEAKEEVKEDVAEDDEDEDDEDETVDAGEDAEILEVNGLKEELAEIQATGSIDYAARLEKIIASRDKIEKDLAKVQKSILKYERTKRRKNRNQKMLDRRAGELTNLNLVMYSVTDIKNVDSDKKAKQEELTAHIAELKASIQDAEEFITSNKEKNDHNVKMAKFLLQEKTRYNEEIAELKEMIKKSEDEAK